MPESLEELGILPPAVKAGIREIKIIGDGIYDDSEYFLETRWIKVNGKNRLVAGPRHRDEQDITQVQTGTMTDLSVLEGMENLEALIKDLDLGEKGEACVVNQIGQVVFSTYQEKMMPCFIRGWILSHQRINL